MAHQDGDFYLQLRSKFKTWIQSQPQQLDQYKMVILENLLIEKLESDLKSKVKVIKFSELANK